MEPVVRKLTERRVGGLYMMQLIMDPKSGMKYVKAALALIGAVVLLVFVFDHYHWSWTIFGGIMGVLFGLIIGLVVIVKLSVKAQAGMFGAALGMGADLVTSATKQGGPQTALNWLADLIASAIAGVTSAGGRTGLLIPSTVNAPLAIGLWIFVATVAIVMLLGALEPKAT
jgi:hypothetical protein